MALAVPELPAAAPRRPPRPRRTGAADAARWRDLVQLVAWHVHALRDLLQLSQEQLAQRAGVSQGAISRMEAGRCTDTPLVTYARVAAAVCRELGPLREHLTPEVRLVLEFVERVLATGNTREPLGLFEDPTLQTLIRVYERLSAPDRAAYAEVIDGVGRWMLERVEGPA